MTTSLAIQSTYQSIEIGLFKQLDCIDFVTIDKSHASKLLIPSVSHLVTKHSVPFTALNFIAVNQGPGPFTTLRVIIATVNGLSFASQVPLVGIDGLQTLLNEHPQDADGTLALLDAFNKDLFYSIAQHGAIVQSGYKNKDMLIDYIAQHYAGKKIVALGNGAIMYHEELIARGITVLTYENCSLNAVNASALNLWQEKKNISYQLFPLYLKQQYYKNQQGIMQAI